MAARSSAASVRSRVPRKELFGSETPRIWTRPLRKLTPRTSLGFDVIDFAEQFLLVELLPWQKWLLIHMLELMPDNTLRFRTVTVLVARQNGKSTLSQVLSLWFMFRYELPVVLGTAQDLDTAESVWEGAVELVTETDEDDQPVRPELFEMVSKVSLVNGKKYLRLNNKARSQYKVKAANRRAGRGLTGDFILLDELREHQSWDAWAAITKTTMARAFALIVALSNAGDATSVVLAQLRRTAIMALIADGHEDLRPDLGQPDEWIDAELARYASEGVADAEDYANGTDPDSLGLFEWSAPVGCVMDDPQAWAQANPSLGYTITVRAIRSALTTDPEEVFRPEVLCQWTSMPSLGSTGTIFGPFKVWQAGETEHVPEGVAAVGIALSADREWVGLTGASLVEILMDDPEAEPVDKILVAPILHTQSIAIAIAEAKRIQAKHDCVVLYDENGPASSLIDAFDDADLAAEAVPLGKYAVACGLFKDRVTLNPPMLLHLANDDLDEQVKAADWRWVSDNRVIGRRAGSESVDVTLLEAGVLAAQAAENTSAFNVY